MYTYSSQYREASRAKETIIKLGLHSDPRALSSRALPQTNEARSGVEFIVTDYLRILETKCHAIQAHSVTILTA
jgi:hypothetical protein